MTRALQKEKSNFRVHDIFVVFPTCRRFTKGRMLLKRGTGSGERGTGNGSKITSSQRYPP